MQKEKGNVSVTTENIFPIIRQWLYSDRDIFLRELVSNASDAIEKLRRLVGVGETTLPEDEAYAVHVRYDKKKGVLSVEDNGIGMTADEVKKYINQIAFSGAMDFVEKYKNKNIDTAGIIGHFGLGFYSAFMVADSVRIDTRSWQPDAEAVHWLSKDGIAYEMGESDRTERGSVVTLQLSDDGKELMEKEGVESILRKYCAFMPYPIYFVDVAAEKKADKKKKADSEETAEEESAPKPVNETSPLWLKAPKDCTDEEYKAFYRDTFMDFPGAPVLDPPQHGLSLQSQGDSVFSADRQLVRITGGPDQGLLQPGVRGGQRKRDPAGVFVPAARMCGLSRPAAQCQPELPAERFLCAKALPAHHPQSRGQAPVAV
jgi:molecular chaperone HtpG